MKKPFIVGNWKANPATLKEAKQLLVSIEKLNGKMKGVYGYAVPHIYFSELKKLKKYGSIGLQNIDIVDGGAHTGKTSTSMTLSLDPEFVILGHSEIRALGERNEDINQKVKACLEKKVATIICVGEIQRDQNGEYLNTIELQIKKALNGIPSALCERVAIAYEPVWAVGSSTAATAEQCFEVVIAIRRAMANLLGMEHAKKVLVLYGGTVNEQNADDFLTYGGADGLLIGRASLDAKLFSEIIRKSHEKGA